MPPFMNANETRPRPLHWVIRVADRAANMRFLLDVLGMQVLRHEEFQEGCAAACNGRYDGMWSKTMVGYAPESESFALEVTYNYGVRSYAHGNDLSYIELAAPNAIMERVRACAHPTKPVSATTVRVTSPEGYVFQLVQCADAETPRISGVRVRARDVMHTLRFYTELLGMREARADAERACVEYAGKVKFELQFERVAEGAVDYAEAGGRLAVAVVDPAPFELAVVDSGTGGRVHTPLVSLETPGKPTVCVVIMCDPDGSEVCVVNEDGFSALSQVDAKGAQLLRDAMAADESR